MGISEYSTVDEKLHYFDWLLHKVLSISRTEDVLVMVSEVGNLNGPLQVHKRICINDLPLSY